jgi:hypothetical protein
MMSFRSAAWSALVLSAALGACDRSNPSRAQVTDEPAPAAAAAPAPSAAPDPTAGTSVTGKILETMDAGGYTYVRLATPAGERWAAVQETKVAVGDTITITNPMVMTNFESKTLHRTFDAILFGSLGGAAASPHGGSAVAAAGAPVPTPAPLDKPLARAAGADGRAIAEIYAQKAALANKPVAVRGKVTKYNGGIMGKNWLHLQDGTGTPGTNDFDLTVTTAAEVAVGDVVVVRGPVHLDKDFGAGYAYAVMIEDATIEK